MSPTHHPAIESWWSSGGFTLAFVAASILYLRGRHRLHSASVRVIPGWCAGSLFLGLISIWVALGSPLAIYDHELLTVHMVQHLLLMTFAPALILLGEPVVPILQGLPRFVQSALRVLFRKSLVQRARRLLSQPAFCWLVSATTLVGWHVPKAFALGLQSDLWHVVGHASFLGAGFLFWWPVVQPWPRVAVWPRWSILLYLFLATLPCDILSGFLVFSERVVYPIYLLAPRHFGMTALEDQQCAAALMWTCVTIVYLVPAALLTTRLLGVRNPSSSEMAQSDLRRTAAAPSPSDSQLVEAV